MTVSDLIAARGLGFTCERVSPEIFRCRITCKDRGMNIFHASSTEPTLLEVVTRMIGAARQHVTSKLDTGLSANRDMASFKHWCVLYGYNPRSLDDHESYLTIRRRSESLKHVLGIKAYKQLLEIT